MKKNIFVFIIISLILFILLITFPKAALNAAETGLLLWFNVVLPALLPFFIGSYILLETGVLGVVSGIFQPLTRILFGCPGHGAYVFLASAFSGYPMGAKLTMQLYENNMITEPEAERIVNLTSVTGPVFIYGAVAYGLLNVPEAGIYIAAPHYVSALFAGVLFHIFSKKRLHVSRIEKGFFKNEVRKIVFQNRLYGTDIGTILSRAVQRAVETLLLLLGFIVLFSAITGILETLGVFMLYEKLFAPMLDILAIPSGGGKALLGGTLEMTTGANAAAALNAGLSVKCALLSGLISFGGLSIHAQTYAICAKSGIHTKGFMLFKTLQALLSGALTALMFKLFPIAYTASNIKNENADTGFVYAGSVFLLVCLVFFYLHMRRTGKA